MRKVFSIFALILLLSVSVAVAYDFAGLKSNGWDWRKYSEDEKSKLVNLMYVHFDVVSDGFSTELAVESMDKFYADLARSNRENPRRTNYGYKMSMRCSTIFGEILENSF